MHVVFGIKNKDDAEVKWYAMSATYRSELKVKEYLDSKQVECFVPLVPAFRVVNRRRVKALVPAVSNLIFVHAPKNTIDALKKTQSRWQYKMMSDGQKSVPVVVPDSQMTSFIEACGLVTDKKNFLDAESFAALDLKNGDRIRIIREDGVPLEGYLVAVQGKRQKTILINAGNVLAVKLDHTSEGYTIEKL